MHFNIQVKYRSLMYILIYKLIYACKFIDSFIQFNLVQGNKNRHNISNIFPEYNISISFLIGAKYPWISIEVFSSKDAERFFPSRVMNDPLLYNILIYQQLTIYIYKYYCCIHSMWTEKNPSYLCVNENTFISCQCKYKYIYFFSV